MKKLIILLSLVVSAFSGNAQANEFTYLNNDQIIGIYNLGHQVVVLSNIDYRSYDNKDIYLLSFLGEERKQVQIEANRGSRFLGTATQNGFTYFAFDNSALSLVELVGLSPDYKVTYDTYLADETDVFSGRVIGMEVNEAGSLFLFRNYSISKPDEKGRLETVESGIEMVSFDKSLAVTGRHKEKERGTIVGAYPVEAGLVLSVETKNVEEKKYDLELMIFNDKMEKQGSHLLTEEASFFPSEVISYDGEIVLAGYSMNESIFSKQQTDGLFLRVLGMDGEVKNTSTFSWEELKALLKGGERGDFIFNGKKTILVEQIIPTDKGFKVICESYASNSGITAAEVLLGAGTKQNIVSVYDFVIFETNAAGTLTAVQILEKAPMNIDMKGAGSMNFLALESALKRHHVLPFKGVDGNDLLFVNYTNQEGEMARMDMITGEITKGNKIQINAPEEEGSEFGKKLTNFAENLEYGIEKIDYVFDPYGRSTVGYFSMDDGSTLVYLYDKERYSVFYELLPIK